MDSCLQRASLLLNVAKLNTFKLVFAFNNNCSSHLCAFVLHFNPNGDDVLLNPQLSRFVIVVLFHCCCVCHCCYAEIEIIKQNVNQYRRIEVMKGLHI